MNEYRCCDWWYLVHISSYLSQEDAPTKDRSSVPFTYWVIFPHVFTISHIQQIFLFNNGIKYRYNSQFLGFRSFWMRHCISRWVLIDSRKARCNVISQTTCILWNTVVRTKNLARVNHVSGQGYCSVKTLLSFEDYHLQEWDTMYFDRKHYQCLSGTFQFQNVFYV